MLRKASKHAKRMGAEPVRFQFTIEIDYLLLPVRHGIKGDGMLSVCFERGGKTSSTKDLFLDPSKLKKDGDDYIFPVNERLELVVTLYRDNKTGAFQSKHGKLLVRQKKKHSTFSIDTYKGLGIVQLNLDEIAAAIGPTGAEKNYIFPVDQMKGTMIHANISTSIIATDSNFETFSECSDISSDASLVGAVFPELQQGRRISERQRSSVIKSTIQEDDPFLGIAQVQDVPSEDINDSQSEMDVVPVNKSRWSLGSSGSKFNPFSESSPVPVRSKRELLEDEGNSHGSYTSTPPPTSVTTSIQQKQHSHQTGEDGNTINNNNNNGYNNNNNTSSNNNGGGHKKKLATIVRKMIKSKRPDGSYDMLRGASSHGFLSSHSESDQLNNNSSHEKSTPTPRPRLFRNVFSKTDKDLEQDSAAAVQSLVDEDIRFLLSESEPEDERSPSPLSPESDLSSENGSYRRRYRQLMREAFSHYRKDVKERLQKSALLEKQMETENENHRAEMQKIRHEMSELQAEVRKVKLAKQIVSSVNSRADQQWALQVSVLREEMLDLHKKNDRFELDIQEKNAEIHYLKGQVERLKKEKESELQAAHKAVVSAGEAAIRRAEHHEEMEETIHSLINIKVEYANCRMELDEARRSECELRKRLYNYAEQLGSLEVKHSKFSKKKT